MPFEKAERLTALPPYLFAEIDRKKKAAIAAGRPILNLGIGDPDQPTPRFIIDALAEAAGDPSTHQYALDEGDPGLREAIATWFEGRFDVKLDTDNEILPTLGSKEAIVHFLLAAVNPGDVVLAPDPCYPPYRGGTLFAGGDVHLMPLVAENDFLPDLAKIPLDVLAKAKVIFVNYPNNPTSACATRAFYTELVALAKKHDLVIASDAAYTEVFFEESPISILEVPGAMDVAIEFHSFSKTFNMTGWRLGWACGNPDLVAALQKMKANIDSGIFTAIQRAGIVALEGYDRPELIELRAMYRARRDALCAGLRQVGLKPNVPNATFYVWTECPAGAGSIAMASTLLEKCDIVATPGLGFGPSGDGYVRFALTVDVDRIAEAIERIGKLHLA
jgi:LL-diaminopimelate aminotransferase